MMWESFGEIYLHREPVDFRKSIDGLSSIVVEAFSQDPFSGSLFLFCNRARNRMKILYWDKSGFALWYKRLEKERYKWPRLLEVDEVVSLTHEQLEGLLAGYEMFSKPHKKLLFSKVS